MTSSGFLKAAVFVLLAAIIGAFVWSFYKNKRSVDLENAFLIQPVAQSSNERTWKEIGFHPFAGNSEVMDSYWIVSGSDDSFYIADNGDFRIKQYAADGRLLKVLGEGNGQGTGEVSGFSGVYLDESGRVWVTDEANGRITIFNQDGTWEIHHPEDIPKRALPLRRNQHVLNFRFDSQLQIRSLTDNSVKKIQIHY